MTYSFEQFCADNRAAYDGTGTADLEQIRLNLERLLQENQPFVEEHCGPDADGGVVELYQDPEKGFLVYAHGYAEGRTSPPHDHGASWAIYGQAKQFTDMTEWNRLDDKSKDGYAEIESARKYRLDPGMAGKFGPHEIHQIHFEAGARFVRVTGADLFQEETLTYQPDTNGVVARTVGSAANSGENLTKRHIA